MDQVGIARLRRVLARLAAPRTAPGGALVLAHARARVEAGRATARSVTTFGFSPFGLAERFMAWWWSLFTPRGVIGWVIGALLTAGTILGWQSERPPARMVSSIEDDGLAIVGDVMVIKYHNVKRRYCKGVVSRWLYDADFVVDGRKQPLWVSLGASAAPPTPLGDQYYSLELTIPPTMRAGTYHYTATTDYSCGLFSWLEPPTAHTPDMLVRLERPNGSSPAPVVVVPTNGAVTVTAPITSH